MADSRGEEELSIMEAVDQLSNMAEIDIKAQSSDLEDAISEEIDWRDPRYVLQNVAQIKESFRVLHRYMQNVVRKDRSSLNEPQVQKGIQAIMVIATEAVHKIDHFASEPISKLKEYTDLKKYYRQQILGQMPEGKEQPEDWEQDLEQLEGIEVQKRGLRDLETVRKDQNYELFLIKGENDKPYFSRALLRHIRLIGNFDEFVAKAEEHDPLLEIRELLDRELHESAKETLKLAAPYIDAFYKEAMKEKKRPFIGSLNKSVMALRMAANPKNLIENQSFKSCLEYYADFHRFLRDAMKAPGYIKRITGEWTGEFSVALLTMTHSLCGLFFLRKEHRDLGVKLIYNMVALGKKMQGPYPKKEADEKKLQIWTDLADYDENIRHLLKHYPNGPIMRTLDSFREEEEFEGFDPLMFHNFPSEQFTFSNEKMHVSVLRLPCPTVQEHINKADIIPEFAGFLRYYKHELKPDKHLLINLQDCTSWKEFARCKALNTFATRAEFHDQFFVLGLSIDSDFYFQSAEYQSMNGGPVFLEQFEEQLKSGESCGFRFPIEMKQKEQSQAVSQILKAVYKEVYDSKNTLSRKERLVFIDLCYFLLIMKILGDLKIDSMSFTCKDAVDKGPAKTAMFYGFLSLLMDKKLEEDFFLWLTYAPALFNRERALLQPRHNRTLLFLREFHKLCLDKRKKILSLCEKLNKNFVEFKVLPR